MTPCSYPLDKTNLGDFMKKLLIVPIMGAFFMTPGCMVAAIGAGMGAAKWGSAKQTEAQAKTRTAYNEYTIEMQKINLQRQKAGLRPEPVIGYEEYAGLAPKKR
jgi:hypothetical protein